MVISPHLITYGYVRSFEDTDFLLKGEDADLVCNKAKHITCQEKEHDDICSRRDKVDLPSKKEKKEKEGGVFFEFFS